LIARAGELFREAGFDAHMVETHHARKLDAPSGTAIALAQAYETAGQTLPVTSVRLGHVPGTHTLTLDAPYEQITISHNARDTRVFADGALRAARWLTGRAGVFTMGDVLGLRTERRP
jgi:4-hydroxy-tetrahydrodipicolinate reductase